MSGPKRSLNDLLLAIVGGIIALIVLAGLVADQARRGSLIRGTRQAQPAQPPEPEPAPERRPAPPRRQSSSAELIRAVPCSGIVYSDPGLLTAAQQRQCYLRILQSPYPDSDKRLLLNTLGWTDWTGNPRFKVRR